MPMLKIYRYISTLLISLAAVSASAQAPVTETAKTATQQVVKQTTALADTLKKEKKTPFISGAAVSVDMCGLIMKAMGSRFSNMEASARLNFKEKYFPIFELGLGDCTREGEENNNKFTTTAPYFRVGMDYNFNKKHNGNRFFGGLRYAFSSFNYDFVNPDFTDETWGVHSPLELTDVKGKAQWAEIVLGVETKLWSIVRLGYNVRYKMRLSQSGNTMGDPWYIPGFGRNGTSGWGGTVNLTFDVGKTARKNKTKLPL